MVNSLPMAGVVLVLGWAVSGTAAEDAWREFELLFGEDVKRQWLRRKGGTMRTLRGES